jgi:hypothetical protein
MTDAAQADYWRRKALTLRTAALDPQSGVDPARLIGLADDCEWIAHRIEEADRSADAGVRPALVMVSLWKRLRPRRRVASSA